MMTPPLGPPPSSAARRPGPIDQAPAPLSPDLSPLSRQLSFDAVAVASSRRGLRRSRDDKDKAATMRHSWIPGVNQLGTHGRWAFAELFDVWEMEADFKDKVEAHFEKILLAVVSPSSGSQ